MVQITANQLINELAQAVADSITLLPSKPRVWLSKHSGTVCAISKQHVNDICYGSKQEVVKIKELMDDYKESLLEAQSLLSKRKFS